MAENRDKQSDGKMTPLAETPYQVNSEQRGQSTGIQRGTGADWFGPLNPLEPTAPPEVAGRIFDIPSGYNLNIQPRAYEAINFPQLRSFADGYDLLRTVIETRKDQMAKLNWNIVPRDPRKRKGGAFSKEVQNIERFLLRPDGVNFWNEWLRMLLEDLLVLDAPAIYRRRTFGGQLYALEPIDGGTIKRVIDDWGRTPTAPTVAYQQVLKGFPAIDYSTDDLIYRPRNVRTHKVYGFSPVEQIIMTVNIGIRRQVWQLQSFTEGNIPEALIGTPENWTPDQIRSFQDWFDAMLEGNTGERRRARFVPGAISKGYVATKPGELFGEAEEWLARVVCFAFSISPQPFVAMMNRSTAETAQETASQEGLAPLQQWVKNLIDTIIIEDFGNYDLEFEWLDENELDPNVKSQIIDREVASGILTLNEGRAEKGLDPYDHEDADRPMFRSTTGYMPILASPEEAATPSPEQSSPPLPGEGEPEEEEELGEPEEVGKADKEGFSPPAGVRSAARRGLELREKWGRGGIDNAEASAAGIGSGVQRATNLKNGDRISLATVKRMKAFFSRHQKNYAPDKKESDGGPTAGTIAWLLWGGNAGKTWAESIVSSEEKAEKADVCCDGEGVAKGDIPFGVAGTAGSTDLAKAVPHELTPPAGTIYVDMDRREITKVRNKLRTQITRNLRASGRTVAEQVEEKLKEKGLAKVQTQPRDADGRFSSSGHLPLDANVASQAGGDYRNVVDVAETPSNEKIKISDMYTIQGSVTPETVDSYLSEIKSGKPIAPVTVTRTGGKTILLNGNHRVMAARAAGQDTVDARVYSYTGKSDVGDLAKAEPSQEDIDAIIASLDLHVIEEMEPYFYGAMMETFVSSSIEALGQVGTIDNDQIVNRINDRGIAWAEQHAADLAGRSKNPIYSLTDSTRDMLRATIVRGMRENLSAEGIAELIRDSHAFSPDRSELISMTEIARANSMGALDGYMAAEEIGVKLRKSWLMLETACVVCSQNAAAGKIDLDKSFPSGDMSPPGHPNCRCVLLPEVMEDEEG